MRVLFGILAVCLRVHRNLVRRLGASPSMARLSPPLMLQFFGMPSNFLRMCQRYGVHLLSTTWLPDQGPSTNTDGLPQKVAPLLEGVGANSFVRIASKWYCLTNVYISVMPQAPFVNVVVFVAWRWRPLAGADATRAWLCRTFRRRTSSKSHIEFRACWLEALRSRLFH